MHRVAMAIAAHPDDIEFQMAGTLLLLAEAGYETHYINVASGNCGSFHYDSDTLRAIRRREAQEAASLLGARFHESLTDDVEIFYETATLRRLASLIRDVNPSILLIPSPQDYMEDHTNTCRLAVTAAFVREMPNFQTDPPRPPVRQSVTLYHAMPHSLRDPLRRRIVPGAFVNTGSTHSLKRAALAAHRSQHEFLALTQGMNSYLQTMEDMSLEVGRMSGRFEHAEGWRRHSPFGFCDPQDDSLKDALGENFLLNEAYEQDLDRG